MSTLLIVSSDPASVNQVEALAEEHGIRTRSVSQAKSAREWLSMQSYSMVLVDSRFGDGIPLELLQTAWKGDPFTVGAIFCPAEKVADEWPARLMGVRIYKGAGYLEQLAHTFELIPTLTSLTEKSVLLVEDLDSPREIVLAYIESLRYPNPDGARNVEEAIQKLLANPAHYFCVITDINMPGASGIKLIEEIRNHPRLAHLPVVVLTANPTAENLVNCIKAGATGFLAKPPHKNALRAELEKAKRINATRQSPRLCPPEEAHHLTDALSRLGLC